MVVLSKDALSFNEKKVGSFAEVKNSTDWLIPSLLEPVKIAIEKFNKEKKGEDNPTDTAKPVPVHYKMTLQADKEIDFLSIKKVLYTLTEAGVQEVNFAVIKINAKDKYGAL